jgi:membrane associated rhomboid family serine protease
MELAPLTIKLLWAAAITLVLPLLLPDALLLQLMLWPVGELPVGAGSDGLPVTMGFMPWQLATHVVVNAGIGDLLFIALTLVFFGNGLEWRWGQRRYGLFLLACVAAAALVQLAVLTFGVRAGLLPFSPVAGAHGVMFGILFACAYLDPHQRVRLLIPPIDMEMRTLVAVFVAIELALGIFGSRNGWAQVGFLGAMLGAWLHIRYWQGKPPFGTRKPPRPKLRSVR